MDFFEVVEHQRACRVFSGEPVDEAVIARVLGAATYAPSAENRQPWVFIIVDDPECRSAVAGIGRRAWESGARHAVEGRLPPSLLADVDRGATGGIAGAPLVVVVCGDTREGMGVPLASSIFPAVQNLLLAANALGLGSAMTTLPLVAEQEFRSLLRIPSEIVPMAVIPLGWPGRRLSPPRRDSFAEKAYRNAYGTAW